VASIKLMPPLRQPSAAQPGAVAFFSRTVLREILTNPDCKRMTKTHRGLVQQGPPKYRSSTIDMLSKWLIAGLVISAVTIVTKPTGASAPTANHAAAGRRHPASLPRGALLLADSNGARTISESARSEAASLFGDRCAVCHGPEGEGNGPGASNLKPKPIDFRSRKWQRSVTDEKIATAIVYGGPSVGLSASMSANPDLETRPSVVAALVEHIRTLGTKRKP
jgi:mono/diheme cytochrome c family protein